MLLLDAPGSGGSARPASPDGYALDNRVAAIESLVQALALDRIDLVGHSLGGWTAGLYGMRNPRTLRRLVLVDAGGFTRPTPEEADLLRRNLTPQTRGQGQGLVSLLFFRRPFPFTGFVVSGLARSYRLESVVETVARLKEADGLLGREENLPPGTVLIWGANDAIFPVSDARRAAARIPGGRMLVIQGVGHDGPLEAPRVFEEALSRALSQ